MAQIRKIQTEKNKNICTEIFVPKKVDRIMPSKQFWVENRKNSLNNEWTFTNFYEPRTASKRLKGSSEVFNVLRWQIIGELMKNLDLSKSVKDYAVDIIFLCYFNFFEVNGIFLIWFILRAQHFSALILPCFFVKCHQRSWS